MKKFIFKYGKWFIVSILLITFVLLVHFMLNDELKGIDTAIYNFVMNAKSDVATILAKGFSFLVSVPFLLIFSIILFFVFKDKRFAIISFGNLGLIFIINQILKYSFSRERPIEWMMIDEVGYSFPSAHAMVSAAFYGMLFYLILQTKISKRKKIGWGIGLSLTILLVGLSRIYLGVHYASDVVGGFLMAFAYLLIVTTFITSYLKCHKSVKK